MRVLAVLVGAQVLSVANSNMIAVALPQLSSDLGASAVQRQWIVDAFVLVFAALLVAGGVLADRYGRRRALVWGLAFFAAGSIACASVSDAGLLIAARVVQALGPPLVLPASLSIVAATFAEPQARARAIGIWGAGSGCGIALGPVLGGVIVSTLGWRWAFGTSAAAAIVLAAAALGLIIGDQNEPPEHQFDILGSILVTALLASVVFGLIEGPARGWTAGAVLGAFVAAIGLAVLFIYVERRRTAPLVDLELLRRPVFAMANTAAATMMFVLLATSVYLSEFLQTFRGRSPLQAGFVLLPLGAATAILAAPSGRLTARIGARTLVVTGLGIASLGTLVLSRTDHGHTSTLWGPLLAVGAGAGVALPATTATAVAAVPATRTGMASAIHNAGRQVGATLGVAVLGSIVSARAAPGTATAYADGLSLALLVATGALLVTAAAAFKVLPQR